MSKHRTKSFLFQETNNSKTVLKRTSNAIFNMKIVNVDKS